MLRAWFNALLAFLALAPPFAAGNEIDGRFYPQKSQYLVGEPVYIAFELVNRSSRTLVVNLPSGHLNCGDATTDYEVVGAMPAGFGPDGCCRRPGTDVCDNLTVRLEPGRALTERFVLNYWFRLDKPGPYKVHLVHDVQFKAPSPGVSLAAEDFFSGGNSRVSISSEFSIVLNRGARVP